MKIHKYINLGIMAGTLSFSLSSCDPDLLDIPQKGVISEETYYKTDEDCETAMAAVYKGWRMAYSGNGGFTASQYGNGFFLKNLLSDDLDAGGGRSDQIYAQELYESVQTATNGWVELYYKKLYSAIYLSNIVIDKFKAEESNIKARNIAESKVIRAICHFELTTLWGTPPIVDHVLNTNEYEVPNSTKEALYSFIEKDLTDAISSGKLTTKADKNDKDGGIRVTLEAAETILGKVYLYQKKYAEAKAEFQKVIDSKKYGLIEDVSSFYHPAANGCEEYVMENVRKNDPSNMYAQEGWYGILGNWAFGYGFIAGPEAQEHYHFNSTSGYSYYNPSKALYDAFVEVEGKNGKRVKAWICPFEDIPSMNIALNSTRSCYANEGYFRLKWLPTLEDEFVGYWCGNQSNTPVIRYADVLLMMAEACLNSNSADQAAKYVNEVRDRAGLNNLESVTMDDIKRERRVELAMDAVRFQDLIRWGDAATVLANKGKKLPTFRIIPDLSNDLTTAEGIYNAKYTTSLEYIDNEREAAGWTVGRDELLPFPQSEIDVNKSLQQNPGY